MILEKVQERAMKGHKGLKHLSNEERQKAGTVQHREEKAQGESYQQIPVGRVQRGQGQALFSGDQ